MIMLALLEKCITVFMQFRVFIAMFCGFTSYRDNRGF